jgi:cysteine-rich repeat protein
VDTGEACDAGPQNSDVVPDACRTACRLSFCGDGVVDVRRGELCDDGNTAAGDGCSPECGVERCGNGLPDPGEACATTAT